MQYDDQVRAELQAQCDALTKQIAALDKDISTEVDRERRLTLKDRRADLATERRQIVQQLEVREDNGSITTSAGAGGMIWNETQRVDYNELTKSIYEIRSDVAVLKDQMVQLRANDVAILRDQMVQLRTSDLTALKEQVVQLRYNNSSPVFPPQYLMLVIVGSLIILALLVFIVLKLGVA